LHKNLGLLSEARIKGREKVKKEFAIDSVVQKLIELFKNPGDSE